jgi:hypothetical protein
MQALRRSRSARELGPEGEPATQIRDAAGDSPRRQRQHFEASCWLRAFWLRGWLQGARLAAGMHWGQSVALCVSVPPGAVFAATAPSLSLDPSLNHPAALPAPLAL